MKTTNNTRLILIGNSNDSDAQFHNKLISLNPIAYKNRIEYLRIIYNEQKYWPYKVQIPDDELLVLCLQLNLLIIDESDISGRKLHVHYSMNLI